MGGPHPRSWLPIGQRVLRPAPSLPRGGGAPGAPEGRDWPALETPGRPALPSRGCRPGKRRLLLRGSRSFLPTPVKREASDPVPSSSTSWDCMSWGRAPVVLLGGGVSLAPPLPVSKFHRASVPRTACKLKVQGRFPSWCRKGSVSAPAKAPRGAGSWGGCGEAECAPLLSGHAAPVVPLDARAAAGGFPPSGAAPSLAVHGFWKPSPALAGLGLRLRPRIGFCSLCHLSQRESRQGDRQVGTPAR